MSDWLDLLDVGVGARHELTGLGLVVEREVQALEVREQPVAQVGLDPVRDAERGVAAEPVPTPCTTPTSEDQARVLERSRRCRRG